MEDQQTKSSIQRRLHLKGYEKGRSEPSEKYSISFWVAPTFNFHKNSLAHFCELLSLFRFSIQKVCNWVHVLLKLMASLPRLHFACMLNVLVIEASKNTLSLNERYTYIRDKLKVNWYIKVCCCYCCIVVFA